MIFRREHYKINIIADDKMLDYKTNEYKPRPKQYQDEIYQVTSMKIYGSEGFIECTDKDTTAVIESSNYFTIVKKDNTCHAIKYDTVTGYEFK